eukprot:6672020-Alexandrium_andersonii.AAC.1
MPVTHVLCDPWQHVVHYLRRAFSVAVLARVSLTRSTISDTRVVDWHLAQRVYHARSPRDKHLLQALHAGAIWTDLD